jgi:mono/diheme cytochrome c family protein
MRSNVTASWRAGLRVSALSLLLLAMGCRGSTSRRPPIHLNPNMDDQPRYEAQEASAFFYNGSASQAPVPGTIARGDLQEDQAFFTGRSPAGGYIENPLQSNEARLERGEERYRIYCSPCHSTTGNGRGTVYERSGLESADLRESRVRELPDGEIFEVISEGRGLMQGYAFPIPAEDRWAIVEYVRKLQRDSQ